MWYYGVFLILLQILTCKVVQKCINRNKNETKIPICLPLFCY